jgi:16S rRNA (uracil1498-N3)-methyltransferase
VVERVDHSAIATFFADADFALGTFDAGEDAAQHARVRRLEPGERARLTNGRGGVAAGTVERLSKNTLLVAVDEVHEVPAPPSLSLFVPVADRDRMLWLGEKCAELAVSVWQPVVFRRSASVGPRGEGESFARKLRARMVAALEQSGGAWLPRICPPLPLAESLVRPAGAGVDRYLLDRAGGPLLRARPNAAAAMIGPEGGLEPDERALIVDRHGWLPATLGGATLRFETAGVVAAGILRVLLNGDWT